MKNSEIQVPNNRSERSSKLLREIVYRDLLDKQGQNYNRFRAYKKGKIMQLSKGIKIDQKTDKKNIQNLIKKYQANNDKYNKQILEEFQQKQKRMYGYTDQFFNLISQGQDAQKKQQYILHKKVNEQKESKRQSTINNNKKESTHSSIIDLRSSYNHNQSPPAYQCQSDQVMYMDVDINKKNDKIQKTSQVTQKANFLDNAKNIKNSQQKIDHLKYQQLQCKQQVNRNIQDEIQQSYQQIEHGQNIQENESQQSSEEDKFMSADEIGGLGSKNVVKQKRTSKSKQEKKNKKQIISRNKDQKENNKQQVLSTSIKSSLTHNKNCISQQNKVDIQIKQTKYEVNSTKKKPHYDDDVIDDSDIHGNK